MACRFAFNYSLGENKRTNNAKISCLTFLCFWNTQLSTSIYYNLLVIPAFHQDIKQKRAILSPVLLEEGHFFVANI